MRIHHCMGRQCALSLSSEFSVPHPGATSVCLVWVCTFPVASINRQLTPEQIMGKHLNAFIFITPRSWPLKVTVLSLQLTNGNSWVREKAFGGQGHNPHNRLGRFSSSFNGPSWPVHLCSDLWSQKHSFRWVTTAHHRESCDPEKCSKLA